MKIIQATNHNLMDNLMENISRNLIVHYFAGLALLVLALFLGVKSYTTLYPRPLPLQQATIAVTGTGEAVGIPDIATMTFSVVEQGDTVANVTATANDSMNQIVSVMKGAGIAAEDIQTTGYNLNPRYDYSKVNRGEIVGYDLTQSVTVTIRQLDSIGTVIDAATSAGANDVSTPSFEIEDPEAVKTEARAEAFAKANAKAESLADAAGVQLGEIVTFNEGDSYNPESYYKSYAADSMMVSDEAVIEPGSEEVNVSVTVTYALGN